MVSLEQTVELMLSEDYKERFQAEVYQLQQRILKLENLIDKYNNGELDFKPDTPIIILKNQLNHMHNYWDILMIRATIENIPLKLS